MTIRWLLFIYPMVCEISSLWISFQVLRENWSVDDILEQGRFELPTVYFFTNEITSYDVGGLRATFEHDKTFRSCSYTKKDRLH